jgi:hypothetical protein
MFTAIGEANSPGCANLDLDHVAFPKTCAVKVNKTPALPNALTWASIGHAAANSGS